MPKYITYFIKIYLFSSNYLQFLIFVSKIKRINELCKVLYDLHLILFEIQKVFSQKLNISDLKIFDSLSICKDLAILHIKITFQLRIQLANSIENN